MQLATSTPLWMNCLLRSRTKDHAFGVARGGKRIHCYRGYASDYKANRHRFVTGEQQRTRVSVMKSNCEWFVKFKFNKPGSPGVTITEVSPTHSNDWNPSLREKFTIVPRSTCSRDIDPVIFGHLLYHLSPFIQNLDRIVELIHLEAG